MAVFRSVVCVSRSDCVVWICASCSPCLSSHPLCLSLPARSLSLSVSVWRLGLCEGDAAIFLFFGAVALKYSLFTFFLSASFILSLCLHARTDRPAPAPLFLALLWARTPRTAPTAYRITEPNGSTPLGRQYVGA